jgi:hypothetical protein
MQWALYLGAVHVRNSDVIANGAFFSSMLRDLSFFLLCSTTQHQTTLERCTNDNIDYESRTLRLVSQTAACYTTPRVKRPRQPLPRVSYAIEPVFILQCLPISHFNTHFS